MHSVEEPKIELFERGTVSKGNKRKNTTKYTIGEGRTDKRCCEIITATNDAPRAICNRSYTNAKLHI
jgi:hypothetical protein